MSQIHFHSEPKLFGEQSVFAELKKLSGDWHVFYSLGVVDRRGFDRQREIDFVALHPFIGLVFIEVKGGSLKFDDGVVRQWLDSQWKEKNPITQLNEARRVCLDFLHSRGVDGFIPARNLYIFPTTERPGSGLSQELMECSIFGTELNSLETTLEGFGSSASRTQLGIDQIVNLLNPCLTYVVDEQESRPTKIEAPELEDLLSILNGGNTSFENIDVVKHTLSMHRESLQSLWWKIVKNRSEIELVGADENFHEGDALVQIMRETSNLLKDSSVEVGVFGQVKRGKSSLVNGLVGKEVSATGMMPKTAVPVTIEYSPEESAKVLFDDGSVEYMSLENGVIATTQAERKRRMGAGLPLANRVFIRLRLDWLESGVRLVDTPGLADPSQTDVYEKFALTELERVSAAIFVVCYPPGPENHEVQIIRNLTTTGLAKLFFVVNVYSDIWKKKGALDEIREYMSEVIDGSVAQNGELLSEDRRVFIVNLGMANEGFNENKLKKIEESGILQLKAELETFLTHGVLERVVVGAGKRLLRAADVIEGTLSERVNAIRNPSRAVQLKEELQSAISNSTNTLDKITERMNSEIRILSLEMSDKVASSYSHSLKALSGSKKRSDLRNIISRLSIQNATLSSELVLEVHRRMTPIIENARRELLASLNVASWSYTSSESIGSLLSTTDFSETMIADYIPPTDYADEARSAGAVIGAILGGGGGIALAATGPLGLAVGGLLGWLFADSFSSLFRSSGNTEEAQPHEIQKVVDACVKAEADTRRGLAEVMKRIGSEIQRSLTEVRQNVLRDSQSELKHIENLLKNEALKTRALQDISSYGVELSKITGRQINV